MQHIRGSSRLSCMSTSHLEPVLELAERCAVLTVLRRHPEWTLARLCSLLDSNNARGQLLRELTLGELFGEPSLRPIKLAADGGPPIDRRRRSAASKLSGEQFDAHVRAVLVEARGVPVGASYLRARVGGPRWKLQAALRRLVEAGVAERSGSTSSTRYWIPTAREHECGRDCDEGACA